MSKRQKVKPYDWSDFQFDQSAPEFETVRRVDLEDAETPADMLAQSRTPAGFADMNRDAQLLPTTRSYDGTPTYLGHEGTLAAQVVSGALAALDMRRVPARGGIAVVLRINGVEEFRSRVMSDEEADHREVEHRAALHALAAARS